MFDIKKLCLLLLALGSYVNFANAAPALLEVVAESNEAVWNAVAVDSEDNVYVAGPKWTGGKGPSVTKVDIQRRAQPFPDERWNSIDTAIPADERFINVNALRKDDLDHLWVVDTGVSGFGGHVIKDGAKLVEIDLKSNKVVKVYKFGPNTAKENSYIDDVRFSGDHAYLTDAGEPGIIVLNLRSGETRRVLHSSPATHAAKNRDIVLSGKVVRAPDGTALRVHSDPLEISHDGKWLYFAALEGPWYKIELSWLNDARVSETELASKVKFWRDLPPVGGTAMDSLGNFYFSDLATDTLKRITVGGDTETVISDPLLHWIDAPTFDQEGRIYLPAAQVDRVALFNNGLSQVQWPVSVFRLDIKKDSTK